MMKPMDHPEFPWTGIFLGAPILGIWYWCTDQVIVQRVLSAKDEGHAKAGTIFAGFLKILPVFVLVLPGLIALALYPQLFTMENGRVTNGDIAYPTLIVNLLPTGLVGLMIAALLAALMGAMSSVFNSASTMVTLDFYKRLRPQATERAARQLRPRRHRRHGRPGHPLGALHPPPELAALHLPAERAGLREPAHRRLLHPRHPLAAPERDGGDRVAARGLRPGHRTLRLRGARQEPATSSRPRSAGWWT